MATTSSDSAPPHVASAHVASSRLVILTGLSGAGKSTAMRVFEDLGFYCLDNLPPGLIPQFYSLYRQSGLASRGVAIASDVRSGALFDEFQNAVNALHDLRIQYSILYLDCASDILVNRFKEVRRSHPLEPEFSVDEAIDEERHRLAPVRELVTAIIDTSHLSPTALRQEVMRIATGEDAAASVRFRFISFGFKHGIPQDADYVFDARFLPNPFYEEALRPLSGEDAAVYEFVMSREGAGSFFDQIVAMLDMTLAPFVQVGKLNITVAIGCTGGRHRSVSFARRLAAHYTALGHAALAVHRDLKKAH